MKNKIYRQKLQLDMLKRMKRDGKKYVIWKLNQYQLEEYEKHFSINPELYAVKTRQFYNIRSVKSNILKKLHYAYKKGKFEITMKLSREDISVLEKFNIKYRPVKYRIILNESA